MGAEGTTENRQRMMGVYMEEEGKNRNIEAGNVPQTYQNYTKHKLTHIPGQRQKWLCQEIPKIQNKSPSQTQLYSTTADVGRLRDTERLEEREGDDKQTELPPHSQEDSSQGQELDSQTATVT